MVTNEPEVEEGNNEESKNNDVETETARLFRKAKEEKQELREEVDARVAGMTDTDKLRQSHYVYLKVSRRSAEVRCIARARAAPRIS